MKTKNTIPDIYLDYITKETKDGISLQFNFDINEPIIDKLFEKRFKQRMRKLPRKDNQ